jgi:GH25 family lysozyme M1 (1,4-beta-N-acetylmuramidase)
VTTLLGIDVSNHQGPVDFGAVKRAGNAFVILKATEGVGFTDATFASNRTKAHAAGLVVGAYHFASGGDPVAEANAFCAVVGSLAAGELVVLDWETKTANPPAWCRMWLDRVAAVLGVKPLIYMNQTTRDGHDWSPVVAGDYGLWIAAYDNSATVVPSPGHWPNVALKQWTSGGSVPGVAGPTDRNVFFGDLTTLAAYGYQGADMPLNDADKAWIHGEIADQLRPIFDTLTPGITGVKYDGDIYAKVTAVSKAATQLLAQPPAQVDVKALAAAIVGALPAAQAQEVVNELGKRLNTPAA